MTGALLLCLALQTAAVDGATLSGVVHDEQGRPLPGATVMLVTGRPRTGTGPFCPSCYPDCSRRTVTGDDGTYRIAEVDSALLFRVLVAAEGRRPLLTEHLDPREPQAPVVLQSNDTSLPANRVVRGRVLDPAGEPIAGAIVDTYAMKTKDWHRGGAIDEADDLAITNTNGEFLITCQVPDAVLDFRVYAPGYATRFAEGLACGEKSHEVVMNLGVTVRGRLVDADGKPAAGLEIGVCQIDRSAGVFLGAQQIGTFPDGRFELPNLPPNDQLFVYTLMGSTGDLGALPLQQVTVHGHGSAKNLGELRMGKASKLRGRVVLPDGAALPPDTQIILAREGAWDTLRQVLAGDGSFEFRGVPAEAVKVIVSVPGYHISQDKTLFQVVDPRAIGVFVDEETIAAPVEIVLEADRSDR
jgi:hypothetical protein